MVELMTFSGVWELIGRQTYVHSIRRWIDMEWSERLDEKGFELGERGNFRVLLDRDGVEQGVVVIYPKSDAAPFEREYLFNTARQKLILDLERHSAYHVCPTKLGSIYNPIIRMRLISDDEALCNMCYLLRRVE